MHTSAGDTMDIPALRDHAAGLLSTIALDIEQPQSDADQERKSKGRAPDDGNAADTAAESTAPTARTGASACSGDLRGEWDPSRVSEALCNLIANAVQHGAASTSIVVTARGEADEVVVSIHNLGRVIKPEDQELIFDPFKRGLFAESVHTPRAASTPPRTGLAACGRSLGPASGGATALDPMTEPRTHILRQHVWMRESRTGQRIRAGKAGAAAARGGANFAGASRTSRGASSSSVRPGPFAPEG